MDCSITIRSDKLTLDGRFEQAELCASTLRKAKLDREYRTGEVLFRSAAFEISRVWSRLAAPPDTPERKALLAKFAKWKEGGSSLAVLSEVINFNLFDFFKTWFSDPRRR